MGTKKCVPLPRLSEFKPSATLLRTGKPLHESHDIIKGVYFDALFLTNGNLANLLNSHGHREGRCPHDVITASRLMLRRKRVFSYQCGFYACSFNCSGHARASVCGTSKSIVPTFFLCRNQNNSKTIRGRTWGRGWQKEMLL